jgi:hypothetical protein
MSYLWVSKKNNIRMYTTTYSTNVQKTVFKYFVFWATQKKISGSQYVFFNLQIITFCYICISHNTKNFVVKFSIPVGYIIVNLQICFHKF